jgi:large subunit ribosomal protein L3
MINLDTYLDNLDSFIEDDTKENDNSSNEEPSMKESNTEEEPPVEEAKTEESPVEKAKSEDTPVEEVEVEAEESPVEKAKSEDTPAEEVEVEAEKSSIQKLKFIFSNLIGKKIGMTQLFSDEGDVLPATVVHAGPCTVTQIKSKKNDGYDSVQLGYLDAKEKHLTKSQIGHFLKAKTSPKKVLKEFRSEKSDNLPSLGDQVDLQQFNVGDLITVTGCSIGKGFAGHMKRHNFSGGRASHGKNSVMRKAGSVGAGTDPGRIFPGKKMAGRMGNDKVTVKNLEVLNIDYNNNLIFIKGALPGSNNNYLYLTKK